MRHCGTNTRGGLTALHITPRPSWDVEPGGGARSLISLFGAELGPNWDAEQEEGSRLSNGHDIRTVGRVRGGPPREQRLSRARGLRRWQSYAAAVDNLRRCRDLRTALARTPAPIWRRR